MTTTTDTIITKTLAQIGLTDKEVQIYLTCLQRGEVGVIELARIAKLSRSTAYFVADQLIAKGLLRFIQKGAHRVYTAEDPRKLKVLLEQEREQLAQTSQAVNQVLPALNMRYAGAVNKPVVSYFVGQYEMQQIFEDALLSGVKEMLFVGEIPVLVEALGDEYMASWNRRKVKAGILTKGIWPHGVGQPEQPFLKASKKHLREVRYTPRGFHSPTYVLIYSNKVAFISSIVESYATLIESNDLSTTMRHWFDELWRVSSRSSRG